MQLTPLLGVVALTIVSAGPAFAQAGSGAMDTVRVGALRAIPLTPGVDSFDVTAVSRTASGETQQQTQISVRRRTLETLNGQRVIHAHFGPENGKPYWDFYLDPNTFATLRFEQHTDIDSAVATASNGCLSGWVHLQNAPRVEFACDRATDRFLSVTLLEGDIIARLPLAAGYSAILARFGVMGRTADGYSFTVTGAEQLRWANRELNTWRVEHKDTSPYGTTVSTMWIDQDSHRVVKSVTTFPNGRVQTRVLRPS